MPSSPRPSPCPLHAQASLRAEAQLTALLSTPDLDLRTEPVSPLFDPHVAATAAALGRAVASAMCTAYGPGFAARGAAYLPESARSVFSADSSTAAAEARTSSCPQPEEQPEEQEQEADEGVSSQGMQQLVAAYARLSTTDAAHLFLQRLLYRLNRLNLFW